MRRLAACLASFLIVGAPAAAGAGLIAEEERASAALTARLQDVLDRRFGPGRAVAAAVVRLSLSERGRDWVGRLLAPPERGAATPEFKWEWREGSGGGRFVLPGIPADEPAAAPGGAEAGPGAPAAGEVADALDRFELGVESLRVRVRLDASLPARAEAEALALVSEAADASPARGDSVTVERAPLPTPLERLLRDPAALASLAGAAAMLGLGAAALLGAAFLALALARGAGALSAAAARVALRSSPAPGADAAPALPPAPEAAPRERAAPGIVVELGAEHVPRLAHLLREQSPEDVALLMPHLKPEVRSAYLAVVPKETAAAIMLAMAPVRYVDPDLLRSLKEELERRVLGVVGGPEQAAEMVRSLGEAERKAVLEAMRARSPEAAAELRSRVTLFEDLGGFDEDVLARVAAALGPEEAAAAAVGDEGLAAAFARTLAGRAGRVFEETAALLRAAPDPARQGAARERALAELEALIASGAAAWPAAAHLAGQSPAVPGRMGAMGTPGLPGPAETEAPWTS